MARIDLSNKKSFIFVWKRGSVDGGWCNRTLWTLYPTIMSQNMAQDMTDDDL
jgi:hypothetical protein